MTSDTLDAGFSNDLEAPRFAGFGVRLGATLIDFLALLPLTGGMFYFLMVAPNPIAYVGVVLLSALYKPFMEATYGATLGKMATKIKVVGKGGADITMNQAFMRWIPWVIATAVGLYANYNLINAAINEGVTGFAEFGLFQQQYNAEQGMAMTIINSVIGFLPLISALFLFGNKRKQAAHDKMAETFVVYKESLSTSSGLD